MALLYGVRLLNNIEIHKYKKLIAISKFMSKCYARLRKVTNFVAISNIELSPVRFCENLK